MRLAFLFLLLPLCIRASVKARGPVPPRQTATQALRMAQWRAAAQKLSAEAEPALRAYVDSPAVRGLLAECCPGIAREPSAQLLRRINEELNRSELVHNFGARPDAKHAVSDTTLQWQMQSAPGYFSNIWEYVFSTNGRCV